MGLPQNDLPKGSKSRRRRARRAAPRWQLEDIPWAAFRADQVDPEILKIVKAAALVEANAQDYATYLKGVFAGDAGFSREAEQWAAEEVQHGQALARWARIADPSFDFEGALASFREVIQVDQNAAASVRGSRSGELIARCMVEVGTSSYYSALGDATREPVLRAICARIAADEVRHYKMFLRALRRYQKAEGLSLWRRVVIAAGRIGEAEDDELAFAYFAANVGDGAYDRQTWNRAYMRRAFGCYRRRHFERGAAMIVNAVGLRPGSALGKGVSWVGARAGYLLVSRRAQRLAAAGA